MRNIFIFLCFIHFGVVAQQQGVYTNFTFNEFHYNPAIVGSTNYHVVKFQHRNQWVGFSNAPSNVSGAWYGSYKNKMKHGYGIGIVNEKVGITTKLALHGNYGYHIKLGSKVRLGFGLRFGYSQYRIKLYDAILADIGDEVLTGNVLSNNALDASTGIYLYSKKWFLSGSMYHLLSRKNASFSLNRMFEYQSNIMTGYTFSINPKWKVQPSVLVSYVQPVPLQTSVLLKVLFKDAYSIGLAYRTDDAFGLNIGYSHKDRVSFTYGFDYSIGQVRGYNNGSHEIGISYIITKKRPSLEEEDDKLNNSILDDLQRQMNEQKKQESEKK